jgi:hypothetical protein
MAGLIRILFPLVGFFCTATVLTGVASYGYLRNMGFLDDEKLFRIVALLNDVDLEKISDQHSNKEADVPPEEMSHEQGQQLMQVAALHLQSKKDDLDKQLEQFDAKLREMTAENNRYQGFKREVELYLEKVKEEAEDSGLLAVRNQIQNLIPKKQAKPILVGWIKEEKTRQVIQLLNGMPAKKRSDILKTFDTPEDLEMLAKIQQQMLDGDPIKPFVEEQMQKLKDENAASGN